MTRRLSAFVTLAAIVAISGGSTSLISGCNGSSRPPSDPACTHPCDLRQTLWLSIEGAPTATITGSGACEGSGTCMQSNSCNNVNITLSGAATSHVEGPDLICHVSAVSSLGEQVEQDVPVHYTGAFCCSGYELPYSVMIKFSSHDGAVVDAAVDAATD